MDEIISIIVPVYKVEPYLRKCLDSIVGQTYRNLQIILVDDGSPDRCGAICDEYAAQDGRVQVIHKPNGGLSSARNAGLEVAVGAYIGFVDSDDWIEPDMYDYLLDGARRENAEIAVCGLWEQFPDYEKQTVPAPGTYDSVQALALLLADKEIKPHVCDKLWKRELFDNISFPEQHVYEDVSTSYRVFEKANKIVCLQGAKYHYLQRSGSILDNRDLKQKLDFYNASVKLYNDLAEKYPKLVPYMNTQRIKAIIGVWSCLLHTRREDRKDVMPLVREMAAFSRQYYDPALCAESMGLAGRVAAGFTRYASMWSFAAVSICSLAYKLKHGHWL